MPAWPRLTVRDRVSLVARDARASDPEKAVAASSKYRVTDKAKSLRLPSGRAEPGDELKASELPAESLSWLREGGYIEEVKPPRKPASPAKSEG